MAQLFQQPILDEPRFQKGNDLLSISAEALKSLDIFVPLLSNTQQQQQRQQKRNSLYGAYQTGETNTNLKASLKSPRDIQWVRDTRHLRLNQPDEGEDGISLQMSCYDMILYRKSFNSFSICENQYAHLQPVNMQEMCGVGYQYGEDGMARQTPAAALYVDLATTRSGVVLMRKLQESDNNDHRTNTPTLQAPMHVGGISHIMILCDSGEIDAELKACLQQF